MDKFRKRRRRGGFTLVELMVVIIIITILASLLVVGVFVAVDRAERARVKIEIAGLVGSIEQYKVVHGSYPPSPGQEAAHLNRLFPRRDRSNDETLFEQMQQMDQAEALVFWLSGFSPDASHPLSGGGERQPLFDFDTLRLRDQDGDNYYEYVPPGGEGDVPYVLFVQPYSGQTFEDPIGGTVSPAINTRSFQIVSAGLEGQYGIANITSFDDDAADARP